MSYLGKISALVTVNTGDFAPKLNAAAKSVQGFARSVERDIGSSMQAASRSLGNIYTPLQKFERALQAASTMKLSFAGFPGAIRSIDELKQRMTSLNNRQIDVILKTSGLKDIESFRDILTGLRSREFDLLVKVGGIDKLNQLRESMLTGDGKIEVVAETKAAIDRVAELKARLADIQAGKVPARVAVEGVEAAAAKLEAAKKAMMDFVVAGSGKGVKASTYLDDLNTQLAVSSTQLARLEGQQRDREEKLSAVQGSQAAMRQQRRNINAISPDQTSAIAAKEKEVADLAGTVANLQRLVDEYAAAKNELSSAKAVATDGGLKQTEKEIRSAERALKDLKEEALAQVSAKLGFQLDMKGLESLLSGEATSQAQQLGEKLRAMGISAADAGKMVKGVMDALGQSDQSAGIAKLQRLQSAAEAFGKPMGEVRDKLVAAGNGIEAGFGPALTKTQGKIEALKDSIARLESEGEAAGAVGALSKQFRELEIEIDAAGKAVNRFSQVRGKLGGLKTGEELVFRAPALSQSLDRSAQIGAQAASLPASAIQGSPKLAANLVEIKRLSEAAANAYARLEAAQQSGQPPNTSAQRYLDLLLARVAKLQDETAKEIKIHVDAEAAKASMAAFAAQAIAANDRLITQERQLAAERARAAAAARESLGAAISRGAAATFAPAGGAPPAISRVADGLADQFGRLQAAARSAFGLPEYQAVVSALGRAGAELQSIESEYQRLDSLDPQRDIEEYRDAWARVESRVRAVSDLMTGGVRLSEQAAQAARERAAAEERVRQAAADDAAADAKRRAEFATTLLPPVVDPQRDAREAKEADDRRRAEFASTRLPPVLQQESENISNAGLSTPLPRAGLEDAFARQNRSILGSALDDGARRMALFGQSIVAVKGSLDSLPAPIIAHFIPAIVAAEQEFARLRALGPTATAEEIERAIQNMRTLEAATARATRAASFEGALGGRGAEDLELNLQGGSLQGYQSQLQILQQAMGRVSSEARGPAVASFMRLQTAISQAFQEGRLDSAATRQEIARLTQEAVRATAQVAGVSAGGLGRQVQRAGDVGRAGLDRFSLFANQAAFAVDDFLSSTGGLEFKLRAISNNITQMGFVLGGTMGLFVGLGAVIAGQVAVGLVKWANGGRTAEDQTKALNDALARQKSLAEELAQAFGSLGDAMRRQAFSEPAQQAMELGAALIEVVRKQKELSRARRADLDLGVQRERAEQNRLAGELEKETDPRRRIAITRQQEESRRNERRFADAASSAPTPTGADVVGLLDRIVNRYERVSLEIRQGIDDGSVIRPSAGQIAAMALPQNLRREMAGMPTGNDAASIREQIRVLQSAQDFLKPAATEKNFLGFQTPEAVRANVAIQRLEETIQGLNLALDNAFITAAQRIVKESAAAAVVIGDAQRDVADAIGRGVPAALQFRAELDRLASELAAANADLQAAQSLEKPEEKEAAVRSAERRVEAVRQRRGEVDRKAQDVRLSRGFGGERTTAAISAMQSSDRFENERAGVLAQARAAADNEMMMRRRAAEALGDESQARQSVEDAERAVLLAKTEAEKQSSQSTLDANRQKLAEREAARAAADAQANAAAKASDAAASLAEFALSVERAVARIRKIGESGLQRSETGADAAQRAIEEGRGSPAARDRAELRLIYDRERIAQQQNAINRDRQAVMNTPGMQAIREERERLESEKKDIEAQATKDRAGRPVAQEAPRVTEARENRLAELRRKEEEAVLASTAGRRGELDAIVQGIAARERELERGRKRDEEAFGFGRQQAAIDRAMGESERQAQEAQDRYITNPTAENRRRRDQAEDQLREDRRRQQKLEDDLAKKEREFESQGGVKEARQQVAMRDSQRAEIIAQASREQRELTPREKDTIARLEDANRAQRTLIERDKQAFIAPERRAADQFAADQQQRALATQGRRLGLTEQQRFMEDQMNGGMAAQIMARRDELKEAVDKALPEDRPARQRELDTFMTNAKRNVGEEVAPMLKEFQMERETALLQGPSRAALQASDITSTQGQAELNRLLRGDDASKDVNLAELRKQTDRLDGILRAIERGTVAVIP